MEPTETGKLKVASRRSDVPGEHAETRKPEIVFQKRENGVLEEHGVVAKPAVASKSD